MVVQYFIVFKDYLIEVLPFLAIGFLLSGLIHEFIPSQWVERHLGGEGIKPLLYRHSGWDSPSYLLFWRPARGSDSALERGKVGLSSGFPGGHASHLCNFPSRLLWPLGGKVRYI